MRASPCRGSGSATHNRWDNGIKRIYCTSSQGRNVSSIYTATAEVQLQHLKQNILVLTITVDVLEQKKGKGYPVTMKHTQHSACLHFGFV